MDDTRLGLKELISKASENKFDYLVVQDVTRLTRKIEHLVSLNQEFLKNGIKLVTISESDSYKIDHTNINRLVMQFMSHESF